MRTNECEFTITAERLPEMSRSRFAGDQEVKWRSTFAVEARLGVFVLLHLRQRNCGS